MSYGKPSETGLWQRTFSDNAFSDAAVARERFHQALLRMTEQAALLSGEVGSALPEFTRHDLSHMDALWELADLLVGPETTLNPAEGFVLGASILVHDLALSHAAYNLTGSTIRSTVEWADRLASNLRKDYGRAPHPAELVSPPDDIALAAERELIRDRHAQQAESLPSAGWTAADGSRNYLIPDAEVRVTYGRLIGSIAASHHWSHDRLAQDFRQLVGAPSFAPASWRVDPMLLACLLRAADAAHLDASRAPDLLAAIRQIGPTSTKHWTFQAKLARPFVDRDRLVFTAPAGFEETEIEAWWLAFDVLNILNQELLGIDSLLSNAGRSRLAVRRVAGIDTPRTFSEVVPCTGWEPVDARIKVTDVASLVRRLGGSELYGADASIGIRELIVNACDAVRARQALMSYRGGRPFAGAVFISLSDGIEGPRLEILDNGIGMSPSILSGPLLDFGRSSWLSPETTRDNPGLIASRFEPIGRFGIGFFSVFMLGRQVQVASRALGASQDDTWIIEFGEALTRRPTLRRAHSDETLDEPGTRVRVTLDSTLVRDGQLGFPLSSGAYRSVNYNARSNSLAQTISFIMPASGVDLWVSNTLNGEPTMRAVASNDWLEIPGQSLLCRLIVGDTDLHEFDAMGAMETREAIQHYGPLLETLKNPDDSPVARACLLDAEAREAMGWASSELSLVTAGPARSQTGVNGMAGLFLGTPSRAARDFTVPLLDKSTLANWTTQQVQRLVSQDLSGEWAQEMAGAIEQLGGDPSALRFWNTADGWLTDKDFIEHVRPLAEVLIVHPLYSQVSVGSTATPIKLNRGTVSFEIGQRAALAGSQEPWPHFDYEFGAHSLPGLFARALSTAWSVSLDAAIEAFKNREDSVEIGTHDGQPVISRCTRIVKDEILVSEEQRGGAI